MAGQGTTVVDFGAFPGKSDVSLAVTGQTSILSGSLVEAWVSLTATADHSSDEHQLEQLRVRAGAVSAGVGFTLYASCDSVLFEPASAASRVSGLSEPRLYGQFNINWAWN